MIELSLETGPLTEKMRQNMNLPFTAVITPCENIEIEKTEIQLENYARCQKCGAYFTNHCNANENGWTCNYCQTKNSTEKNYIVPKTDKFEIKTTEAFGPLVTVMFISLDFHEKDMEILIPIICSYLKSITDRNIIIMLGTEKQCSILCPHVPLFKYNGKIVYNPPTDYDVSQCIDMKAPIINFTDEITDLSPYIFAPSQLTSAINTISVIKPITKRVPFSQFQNSCQMLLEKLDGCPIHIIAVIPVITNINKRTNLSDSELLHIDILTPSFNENISTASQLISGRILFFISKSFFDFLSYVTKDYPIFSLIMRARSRGAETDWRQMYFDNSETKDGILFSSSSTSQRPFALDIHPKGEEEISIQITVRMTKFDKNKKEYRSVLRVFSLKIPTSGDQNKVVLSVNAPCVLWIWYSRIFGKPPKGVLAPLFRVAANLVGKLPEDSEQATLIIRSICTLKFIDFLSDDGMKRYIARSMVSSLPPRLLPMAPEICGENVISTLSGVFADKSDIKDAQLEAVRLGLYPIVKTPIPNWAKSVDEKSLEIFEDLLPDDWSGK